MTTDTGRDEPPRDPFRDDAPLPRDPVHRDGAGRVIHGGDADLVAYALCATGYLPWGSVLHVAMLPRPGGLGTGTVARSDLAQAADAVAGPEIGACVADALVAAGACGVLEVVVGRPADRAERFAVARRRPDVLAALEILPGWLRWGERALLVEGERYGHVHCAADCCPPQGRPLTEVFASRLATAEVLDGRALVGGRADFAVTPCAEPGCAGAAHAAAAETDAVRAGAAGRAGSPTRAWRRRRCATWDRALADYARAAAPADRSRHPVAEPEVLGELAAALADVRTRDAVLGAVLAGGERGRASGPLLDRGALTDRLWAAGPPPVARARSAGALLVDVAAHAPDGLRVHALAALGYLRWWTGQGAQADVVTRQALAEDPRHRLAGLVGQALGAMVPPPWFATPASPGAAADPWGSAARR